jgi:NAD(P)H-dependent FMN reductase
MSLNHDFAVPHVVPRDVSLLVFAASLRGDSLNVHLAHLAAQVITANGGDVDLATMAEFDAPSFKADLEGEHEAPAGALELQRRFDVNVRSFMELVEASKHYPSAKSMGRVPG